MFNNVTSRKVVQVQNLVELHNYFFTHGEQIPFVVDQAKVLIYLPLNNIFGDASGSLVSFLFFFFFVSAYVFLSRS